MASSGGMDAGGAADRPRLRFVETCETELREGEPAIMVRDPEGLCEQVLAIPLPLFMIATLFDGRRQLEQVREIVNRSAGAEVITETQLAQLVDELDLFYLLENKRTAARRLELERAFAALPARPAAHAGLAYPDDPEQCRAFFEELFLETQPPGAARPAPAADHENLIGRDGGGSTADGRIPRGLINPHVDLRVGGRCIAAGLAHYPADRPADLYIILGVAHQPTRNLFTLTDKPFETPLGTVATDTAAAARLRELYGSERLIGELVHRTEHSVEFQAIALRHRHGDHADFKILPILCSSLHEEILADGPSPIERAEVREFIDALRRLIEEHPGRVSIIASVDLSHVGRKFGDERGIDDFRKETVRREDHAMLEYVRQMDPERFFRHFRLDANARNVDAVSAVYVMLHVLGEGEAGPLDYHQWHEEATDSLVSFATLPIF